MGKISIKDKDTGNKLSIEVNNLDRNKTITPEDFSYVINTIKDLSKIKDKLSHGDVVFVKGYHEINDGGGGTFIYDVNINKFNHNGGTIIDPDKDFPIDWSNNDLLDSWFSGNNEGGGVLKRAFDSSINVKWFGAVGNGIADDSKAIQIVVDQIKAGKINGAGFKENIEVVFGSNNIFLINSGIILEEKNSIILIMNGSVIHNVSSSPIFKILRCNYVTIKGGQLIVDNDEDEMTCGIYINRSKFLRIENIDISSNNSIYTKRSSGIILEYTDTDNDITGYNFFNNIRLTRLANGIILRDTITDLKGSSKLNYNTFKSIILHTRNGIKLEGASNNRIDADFECSEKQIILKSGRNGIPSNGNIFYINYSEGSKIIEQDENSKYNMFIDVRSTNPVNPDLNTTSNGITVNKYNTSIVFDPSIGGIKISSPMTDMMSNIGGISGYNILPYSNNFSKWSTVDCKVGYDTTVFNPDNEYGAYRCLFKTTSGKIFYSVNLDYYDRGKEFRMKPITGRIWLMSMENTIAKVSLKIGLRRHIVREAPLQKNVWSLVTLGTTEVPGITGEDEFILEIEYDYKYNNTGVLYLYEAGIYCGYPYHNKTNDESTPRGPTRAIKAENVLTKKLWLNGYDEKNVANIITISDNPPTEGVWRNGDIIINRNYSNGVFCWIFDENDNEWIEYNIIKNKGEYLNLGNLPTSDPGIFGQVWNDNGVLKISQE